MKDSSDQLIDPIKCKDCANGHFIVPCRAAKIDHSLLRYVANIIQSSFVDMLLERNQNENHT